jgi:branched-subunit amino acid aminotransferase/4-amino-4-deoxychorismate lyase
MSNAEHAVPGLRVYLNGRILSAAEARVAPSDRGFLYGDGFFETTRVIRGAPLFLLRHLDRLASSCAACGFGRPLDVQALDAGVRRLIEANRVSEGYLRITVTRGLHGGRLDELATDAPTVFADARPMTLPPLDDVPPMTLARSPFARDERSPLVRHKSLSYQLNVLALAEGRRRSADEVFFLNSQGQLTEGAITNLFLVRGGVVCTADIACGLLPGVTRQVILELCAEHGVPAAVGVFTEADLREADEVFCTNSLRGLMSVTSILEYPEKSLSACPVASRLRALYAERASAPR